MPKRFLSTARLLSLAAIVQILLVDRYQKVAFADETRCVGGKRRSNNDHSFDNNNVNHFQKDKDATSQNYEIENENKFQPVEMRRISINFDRNISLDVLEATSSSCSTSTLADDTGLMVWGPSIALSQYLIKDHAKMLSGKRVLELGCGAALPSMISYRLGAAEVIATDFQPQTLEQVQYHAQLNGCSLHVELVDWTEPTTLEDFQPDIMLAADVIYGLALVPPLVNTIEQILPKSSTLIIATRDDRIGIPEFRQMMKMNFVEVQVEKSTNQNYLPSMPKTIADDPLSQGRWSGKHSIFTYRWLDEN